MFTNNYRLKLIISIYHCRLPTPPAVVSEWGIKDTMFFSETISLMKTLVTVIYITNSIVLKNILKRVRSYLEPTMENDEPTLKRKKYGKRGAVYLNNRKYQKISPVKNGWRLWCTKTEEGQRCNGKGRYLDTGEFIQKPTEVHSTWCKPIEDIKEWEEMKENYKRDVAQSIQKPRAVFDRHMEQLRQTTEKARTVHYPAMKNITTYAKKKVNPPQPKDLEEMAEFLTQEQFKSMLDYKWQKLSRLDVKTVTAVDDDLQSAVSIVLADEQWINHVLSYVEHTIEAFSDGTFRITPSKLKTMQLFKLEVACFNKGLAYALMERRKSVDYESVIRCIVEKFAPQFLQFPVKVHLDFENGERQGWLRVVPLVQFVLCVFHFNQIQWRNARSRGALQTKRRLKKARLSDAEKVEKEEENKLLKEIRRALKFIMAMPVLSLEYKADKKLLNRIIEGLSEKAKKRLDRYVAHFNRNWLSKKNPPESWNVLGEPHKMNNFSESGNRLMNSFFPNPHPESWTFVRALVLYHKRTANEFKGNMGKSNLKNGDTIQKYTKLLLNGSIGRLEFLSKIVDEVFPHYEEKFHEEVESRSQEEEKQRGDNKEEDQQEKEYSEEDLSEKVCSDEEYLEEERLEEKYLQQEYLEEEYLEEEYLEQQYLEEEYEEKGKVGADQEENELRKHTEEGNAGQLDESSMKIRKCPRKQAIEMVNREGGEIEFKRR